MLDFSLRGTYDVLAVPLLLPEHVVRDVLLPPSLSPGLLPVPQLVYEQLGLADAVRAADGTPQRLVLLQLGYQSHTGPGALNRLSRTITAPKDQGASQAMLYATPGIENDEDLTRAMVGVASVW